MSGIIFWKTRQLDAVRDFYTRRAGMSVWLEQADCVILKHGNLLAGFCSREEADTGGLVTIFYASRSEVDAAYGRFKDGADAPPRESPKYGIYHFFTKDPEGRGVEFQSFDGRVVRHRDGPELLASRRSIRRFEATHVPDDLIEAVLESCRFAPSARNSQPCSFTVIRDPDLLARLSLLRGDSSAPIGQAPAAIAVSSDPSESRRAVEDGCIATYHLLLAAWVHGLGTCWIGGLDLLEAKRLLGIPQAHYLATVTPIGFPAEAPEVRERRPLRVREL